MRGRKPQKTTTSRRRPRLTHFEVRRGDTLRLRLAIADDALAEVGDELGALLKKIAPSAVTTRDVAPGAIEVLAQTTPSEFVLAPQHTDDDHAGLRARLAELFGSLCDASLADALQIAREERSRRTEGGN